MSYQHHQALPAGTHLHEYEIQSTLGGGGFGVAYLAYDHELAQQVVLKEYLPSSFATRLAGNTVVPVSTRVDADYQWGLERFLGEARALAAFRQHSSIVSVLRYFKANNTAYMVMEYAGEFSLQQFLDETGTLTQEQLLDLVLPLLDVLEAIHATGLIHRDIKPDNILISDAAQPVLIDFGAARQAVGERGVELTQIFTVGYAPLEQYSRGIPQGPWTDIYGMAAVMYRCVTGRIPVDALARGEQHVSLAVEGVVEGYSPRLLQAIDWGLQMGVAERPQTIAQWRAVLLDATPSEPGIPPSSDTRNIRQGLRVGNHRVVVSLLGGILALGLTVLSVAALFQGQVDDAQAMPTTAVIPQPAASPLPPPAPPPAIILPVETPAEVQIVPEDTQEAPPVIPIAEAGKTTVKESPKTKSDKKITKNTPRKPRNRELPSYTPRPSRSPQHRQRPAVKPDSRDCLAQAC